MIHTRIRFLILIVLLPILALTLTACYTVIAMYSLPRKRDVCLILFVRVLLAAAFGGGINAFFYSVAGAVLSLGVMLLLKGSGKFSILGVSMAGGIFHNLGQVLVASLVVANLKIMLYLPVLAVAGAGTGLLIGITSVFTLRHLKKLPIYKRMQE